MIYELNKLIILIVIINIVWFVLNSIIPDSKIKVVFKSMAQVIITCLICIQVISLISEIFSNGISFTSLFTSPDEYQSISFSEYIEKYKEILLPYLE